MDLIRELMLKLEAIPLRAGGIFHLEPEDSEISVPGYDADAIAYHLSLINDAGLIDDGGIRPMVGIGFRGFTWEGHDFIDSVRDPEIWKRTSVAVKEVGGFTLDLVKSLAKGFIKKQIEQHTGVQLDL
ncbi:DUF2513 domain-containing protein [Rhizobium hainanense]|uniref:DUF2513 domain-containing protein n=1 Tax=Rhizobium hainanense TaxID=52131 RepID=A0A1C3V876_9HYPH|nr:DUF2513 domain-containing protein [Rhizobium hainanense]SCB23878.1 Hypothetical protein GA0061100_104586 [Rhizobium hainanense]